MNWDVCVIVLGEDVVGGNGVLGNVGIVGGVMGVIVGLYIEFGGECVIDILILEFVIIGVVNGVVMIGMWFVVEIMFVDFVGVCFD